MFLIRFVIFCLLCSYGYGQIEGIYCGKDNCYDVLGVTRDDDKPVIMRAYRRLARVHHPDRQKTQEAKEQAEIVFKKIVTAYDILKDEEQREEYDYMLDNPEEMYYHYYQYFKRRYTTKVDVRIVIFVLISMVSCAQYYAQWSQYQWVIGNLLKNSRYRSEAKELARQDGLLTMKKKENGKKISKEYMKNREEEIIRAIITEKMNIRTPCSKPSVLRTLWFQIILSPYWLFKFCCYWSRWFLKFWILRHEYQRDDKLEIIRRYMSLSKEDWDDLTEADKDYFLRKDLWKKDKYQAYADEQEEIERSKAAESTKRKRERRLMKKGGPGQIVFGPDDAPDFDF